jgi:hypothetical protein
MLSSLKKTSCLRVFFPYHIFGVWHMEHSVYNNIIHKCHVICKTIAEVKILPCKLFHLSMFWFSALTIDCYDCKSQNGDHKECDDTFERDITTYSLISRNCYYGFWKAQFCIKLKGIRGEYLFNFLKYLIHNLKKTYLLHSIINIGF